MELVFKIPTFYKNRYGAEIEIDEFCSAVCEIAKEKEYSIKINRIDFIPAIIPEELIKQGKGKEFTRIELKYKALAMCRQINFEEYQNSEIQEKKILLANCLVEALNEVKKKIEFELDDFARRVETLI